MRSDIRKYNDTLTMAGRCLRLSKRNPDTFLTSILLPALMMVLFISLFGNLVHLDGISYVDFIVPGILLQCIAQGASTTAIMINKDMTSGIVTRFSTLPIRKSSILEGHIVEAFLRSILSSAIVLTAAVCLGFRPFLDLADLAVVLMLLTGMISALSWFAVVVGIAANSAEGASALSAVAVILPYLSSGFVPTEALPEMLRGFAKYQPMTSMIDAMRNAFLESPLEWKGVIAAGVWCIGLTAVFYVISLALFRRRLCGSRI